MERTAIAGSPRSTGVLSACDARSRTAGSSAANTLSHGERHRPSLQRNDKNWLDQARKTNLLEYAVEISAHKKLIHTIDSHYATESRSTDYSRNSCRMRYYYHAQLFEITRASKIKSLLSKNRATTPNLSTCFDAASLRMS
jgi:hypothetical protein